MNRKKREYYPKAKVNPIVLSKRIEKLGEEIERLKRNQIAVHRSSERHLDYLANFARHDMGNAIQNIAANVEGIEKIIPSEALVSLRASIINLNDILANFGSLLHNDSYSSFKLSALLKALHILVTPETRKENISFTVEYDRQECTLIRQPFQPLLQMLHNIVLNAEKALSDAAHAKKIAVTGTISDDLCVITIADTGRGIADENVDRIFDYKFTTTDGCGIGLYHARSICDEIDGEISLTRNADGYTTIFTIKFPTNGSQKDIGD